jgi:hypothetical protein
MSWQIFWLENFRFGVIMLVLYLLNQRANRKLSKQIEREFLILHSTLKKELQK